MELNIFESILNGELRPWEIDAKDSQGFTNLIEKVIFDSPNTNLELFYHLEVLIGKYPILSKQFSKEKPNQILKLHNHFYQLVLPKYQIPIEHFYYLVIYNESIRVFNSYLLEAGKWTEREQINFEVNKVLEKIKVLADQVVTQQFSRNYDRWHEGYDLSSFVLFSLKRALIVLYFEVQERHFNCLNQTVDQVFFHLHYVREHYHKLKPIKPDWAYYEFHLSVIQSENRFPKDKVHELLKQINESSFEKSEILQAAFENLLFFNLYDIKVSNQSIEELTEVEFTKQYFEKTKLKILKPLYKLQFGQDRFDVIMKLLDDLSYIQTESNNKFSITQKLNYYLLEQKAIYSNRFSEKFPVSDNKKDRQKIYKTSAYSFGFKGDIDKLKKIISELCRNIDLLNTIKTEPKELIDALTAKDLIGNTFKIYINCETGQFRHIVDCFKPYFKNFKLSTIEKSGIFISKNGVPITAQNLSASKIESPKEKPKIDEIFKGMQ